MNPMRRYLLWAFVIGPIGGLIALLASMFLGGVGAIVVLFGWVLFAGWRTRKIVCPHCGVYVGSVVSLGFPVPSSWLGADGVPRCSTCGGDITAKRTYVGGPDPIPSHGGDPRQR